MTPNCPKGRGTGLDPKNRFDTVFRGEDPDLCDEAPSDTRPKTEFYADRSRSILTRNTSPDVGFDVSVNPYRGCEHGCSYCYARPTHEYLSLSSGLDFETKIFYKANAAELLEGELISPKYDPSPITLSGITDPYQPIERRMQLTRACLQVLETHAHPVNLITKNALITRDIDLLGSLADQHAASVTISLTTLDAELSGVLEPRASRPEARLRAIEQLRARGIPTGVNLAPMIPGLTDHEIPALLKAAAEVGATHAGFVALRLPYSLKAIFENWLETHVPLKKDKVLNRLRDLRGGKLNDSRFGSRMRGQGPFAEQMRMMFRVAARQTGISTSFPETSFETYWERRNERESLGQQQELPL